MRKIDENWSKIFANLEFFLRKARLEFSKSGIEISRSRIEKIKSRIEKIKSRFFWKKSLKKLQKTKKKSEKTKTFFAKLGPKKVKSLILWFLVKGLYS